MQLTPEVETPTITITTFWPGASPQEVEQEIIVEQEEQLKGVEGVNKLSSESSDSQGVITLEFNVGTDMDQALLKVNSRLNQVREYPEDADQPVITTANSSNSAHRLVHSGIETPLARRGRRTFAETHPEIAEPLEKIARTTNPAC